MSAAQSNTPTDDDFNLDPDRAIDLHLGTYSYSAATEDGKSWLKVTLGKQHCVQEVHRYSSSSYPSQNWTCSENGCSDCVGNPCNDLTLTVSNEGAVSNLPSISDCRYGDTVKLERNDAGEFAVYELAIIAKEGNFKLHCCLFHFDFV